MELEFVHQLIENDLLLQSLLQMNSPQFPTPANEIHQFFRLRYHIIRQVTIILPNASEEMLAK